MSLMTFAQTINYMHLAAPRIRATPVTSLMYTISEYSTSVVFGTRPESNRWHGHCHTVIATLSFISHGRRLVDTKGLNSSHLFNTFFVNYVKILTLSNRNNVCEQFSKCLLKCNFTDLSVLFVCCSVLIVFSWRDFGIKCLYYISIYYHEIS